MEKFPVMLPMVSNTQKPRMAATFGGAFVPVILNDTTVTASRSRLVNTI